jgi:ribosomal protein S19E (S16A)
LDTPDLNLSASEKRTLRHVADGELHAPGLDWLALQHLKSLGLIEERSTGAGIAITEEGRRALQRLLSSGGSR